jgi:hypothetical protein
MDVTHDQAQGVAGEAIGTGWRTAAWMAFALALAIASQVTTTKPHDMMHGFVLAMGTLLMLFVSALGVLFAIFGVAASAEVGDRRFVVLLPALANGALVLWFAAIIFAP